MERKQTKENELLLQYLNTNSRDPEVIYSFLQQNPSVVGLSIIDKLHKLVLDTAHNASHSHSHGPGESCSHDHEHHPHGATDDHEHHPHGATDDHEHHPHGATDDHVHTHEHTHEHASGESMSHDHEHAPGESCSHDHEHHSHGTHAEDDHEHSPGESCSHDHDHPHSHPTSGISLLLFKLIVIQYCLLYSTDTFFQSLQTNPPDNISVQFQQALQAGMGGVFTGKARAELEKKVKLDEKEKEKQKIQQKKIEPGKAKQDELEVAKLMEQLGFDSTSNVNKPKNTSKKRRNRRK
eukprot:TRINITY_DN532_c0_g1_i1.p1 TRINITY_DN532_c0_g1~~TRINITY_DN532_c0_g1_i1.p1  ORF type:complete len:294 (-),score=48.53 TRINITY_DN532_c0_g1_i1:53-934(-)